MVDGYKCCHLLQSYILSWPKYCHLLQSFMLSWSTYCHLLQSYIANWPWYCHLLQSAMLFWPKYCHFLQSSTLCWLRYCRFLQSSLLCFEIYKMFQWSLYWVPGLWTAGKWHKCFKLSVDRSRPDTRRGRRNRDCFPGNWGLDWTDSIVYPSLLFKDRGPDINWPGALHNPVIKSNPSVWILYGLLSVHNVVT